MFYIHFLLLLKYFTIAFANSYQCSSDFPLVTDLSQEDCDLEGKYFEEEHDGCFPGCYSACKLEITINYSKCCSYSFTVSNIAIPCDPQRCPPGYECTGNYCEIDEGNN